MQNPNEDTEWNDILRAKGILPQKEKEVTEDDIVNILESTVQEKTTGKKSLDELDLDDLDELEDEEDEKVLLEYRNKRIAEMRALSEKAKYGEVREISGEDYVEQVNKAGEGVWVVLHLYKQGIPLCALINQHLSELATKFKATKFLKSISTTCVPNYPDRNLPTIFVYFEGDMKAQLIGPASFRRADISIEELEYLLGQTGAFKTDITEDPRPKPKDVLFSTLKSDNNDWDL
ncbi:viral IAP-associated factor homolog [Macrosteles quadrilineatus]|uniref:viral IAP-associated factor homolog n=1 Tax=Macrosteles quadrilineatus TaxID=74068 RepID=UPI0023E2AA67|nr:viral IAP-associated factor homolog [Macrosteles quadrilineatus]XP_054268965.1 viral IAP-associated factor homolog [Macrosteles quadrilineatus]XP_054268966.1 viral IAP-associated factor homolog [Macrosteles quadrilineatus]XP_054268967.1 viral IAP-associated factor homolog [Macrosteles quadrilineatus]